MGEKPDRIIDQQQGPGGDSSPLIRPYRRRHFRETPQGPVPYLPDDDPRHGTYNGYSNFDCRCVPCKRANADTQADYKARRRAVENAGAA